MADPIVDRTDTNSLDVIDVSENVSRSSVYRIYLDKDIDEPSNYRSICNVLNKASEKDTVRIVLNTTGGYNSSMFEICHYLQTTRAKTIAEVHMAYSAGSFIMMHCDEISLTPYSNIMIHSSSYGDYGKAHEVVSRIDFEKIHLENIFYIAYKGFLSSDEIRQVLEGKDFWFNDNQIKQRLKKWKPMRDRKKLFTIRD